ncbi:MAG: hypothetical protein WDZ38_04190 [Balneolaceae bacterium]
MIYILYFVIGILISSTIELNSPDENNGKYSATENLFEVKLESGIKHFYNTDWVESGKIFKELKEEYPDDPRPYFFEAMEPFLEYFLIEQTAGLADEFLSKSEVAVNLSEKRLSKSPGDTTMVLLLSGLHGYRGLVAAGQNRHKIALSSGLTGFNYTRKLLSLSTDRPSARIGRGMFYYMVGSIPSGMRWASNIIGLRADIEDGFDELKMAADSDSYISNDAKMMLMYLYEKEGRYQEALHFADLLTEELPDNVIFLFKRAEILEKIGNKSEAMNVYKEIVVKNNPSLSNVTDKSSKKIDELEKIR